MKIFRSAEDGFSGGITLICKTSSSLFMLLLVCMEDCVTFVGCEASLTTGGEVSSAHFGGGDRSRALFPSRPEAVVAVGDLFFCVVTRMGGGTLSSLEPAVWVLAASGTACVMVEHSSGGGGSCGECGVGGVGGDSSRSIGISRSQSPASSSSDEEDEDDDDDDEEEEVEDAVDDDEEEEEAAEEGRGRGEVCADSGVSLRASAVCATSPCTGLVGAASILLLGVVVFTYGTMPGSNVGFTEAVGLVPVPQLLGAVDVVGDMAGVGRMTSAHGGGVQVSCGG